MRIRRQGMLEIITAFPEQRPLIYILAMLSVLIGLGIVLARNRWSGALAIVVTLIGWVTLLRGGTFCYCQPRPNVGFSRSSNAAGRTIPWRSS